MQGSARLQALRAVIARCGRRPPVAVDCAFVVRARIRVAVDNSPRVRLEGAPMTISAEQARRLGKAVTRAAPAPPRRRAGAFLALFLAGLSSATLSTGLSLGAGAVSPPREEIQMKSSAKMAVAAVSLGVSQLASGQAVQWRVEDGGNGHWYQLQQVAGGVTWNLARDRCEQAGGHLATITDAGERAFVQSLTGSIPGGGASLVRGWGPWIGGFQDPRAPMYGEPAAGWRWVTDEPWSTTFWTSTEPNNRCAETDEEENYLSIHNSFGASWNDLPADGCDNDPVVAYWLEFDADCNSDGIVDYGQCRDGSLPDYNGNNIPDCCEQGAPCVVSNYPVQWRVEDGGNGHWYQTMMSTGSAISWSLADLECSRLGGHLASITSAAENTFVAQAAANPEFWTIDNNFLTYCIGPWLGGFQSADAAEPAGGWSWVSGEPWGYQHWYLPAGEPNNGCGGEDYLHYLTQGATTPSDWWNDGGGIQCPTGPKSFVIEWSADCNNDGVVDYGQILTGQLADSNANGVPDSCESVLHVPSEFATIQAAIDAVPTGAVRTVLVAAGTYNESFSLNGKDVVVRGAPNNATILDGTGLATSIARLIGSETATAGLENIVFRNGTSGSRIVPKATFTVGGAVYGRDSSAFIRNCRFEQNEADFGGAVYLLR